MTDAFARRHIRRLSEQALRVIDIRPWAWALGAGYRIREPTEQEKAQARSKSWPQWPPETSVLIFDFF